MQNIVICGDVGERELTETIIKLCEMNGGAIVSDRGRVYETREQKSHICNNRTNYEIFT